MLATQSVGSTNGVISLERARPAPPVNDVPPVTYDPDQIHLTGDPRQAMAMVVQVTGRPLGYTTERQQQQYIASLRLAEPTSEYDPNGFLTRLGLWGIQGAGRNDRSFVHAVKDTAYHPHFKLIKWPVGIPGFIYNGLLRNSQGYQAVQGVADPLFAAYSNHRRLWEKPLAPAQTPRPTPVTPQTRYARVLGAPANEGEVSARWGGDFHSGVDQHGHGYGTYQIARAMGFDNDQATRLGRTSFDVDLNKTPYGLTSPIVVGQMDRHFNFARDGEDTRILWARRHLELAIRYGRQGAYDEAETELGVGLHSLQDLFAHGQVTPSVHATLGKFVDSPEWSPVSFVETTVASRNYLRAYITGVTSADGDYALPPEPAGR